MALAYAGEDYEDIVYNFGATEGADDHWGSQKFNLKLAFPNLPWYRDDNVRLTQSNAIVRHIGRKYNLYGKDKSEASKIDMLIDTAADIQNAIVKIIFSPECVRAYRKVTSNTPVYYSILNSFGQRSQYISIKFPLHKQCENPKMCY